MSYELIALLMFSSMFVLLLTGQRVYGAIGFVAALFAILLWGQAGEEMPYSAAFKLFSTYGEIWQSLQVLDPWFFTMAVTLMLASVMIPSVLEHVRKFLVSLFDHSYLQPVPVAVSGDRAVPTSVGREVEVDHGPDVVNIHTRNSVAPSMDSYENHRMLKMLVEVLDRVDTM